MGMQDDAARYLHDTLGIRPASRPWPGASKLPYHLQDQFDLHELRAADRAILLALQRKKKAQTVSTLRDRLNKLKSAVNCPVIYVTGTLASYERKRLIEQKVPFMVPGNQLYLPDLGIDLREYFRQPRKETTKALSPATQAMVLKALLSKSTQTEWLPADMGRDLGYTVMTVSRAVSELIAAGVARLDSRGRARWLLMEERSAAATWDSLKSRLRSPVKRRFWVRATDALMRKQVPLAGLSALSRYGQLTDPTLPVYAIGAAQLKTLKNLAEIPEALPDSCELEVWTYSPILDLDTDIREKNIVDPLSLTLSLEESTDERVQLALEELKEHFPW